MRGTLDVVRQRQRSRRRARRGMLKRRRRGSASSASWSDIPPLVLLPDYGHEAIGEEVARDFGGKIYYGSVADFA